MWHQVIIRLVEDSLEESFVLYQKGIEKLKICNEKIDAVEKKLLILNQEGQYEK